MGRLQQRRDLARSPATGSDQAREAAAHFLAEISEVAALEALRANAKAVELLTGQRWYVMKSAREAGATWAQIGEALGITKQAAHDFYSRKIEEQEKYLSDLHDTAAARAVLDE
jgi:HPt (histidine-containing phosphotransfer) domain-containing protein